MSEQLPIQTPLPEDLPQSRPQGEPNRGLQERTFAASEFAVNAGQDFVDRVARVTLPVDELAKDAIETSYIYATSIVKVAGRAALNGIKTTWVQAKGASKEARLGLGLMKDSALDAASDAWTGIKTRATETREAAANSIERRKKFNQFLGAVALDHAIGNRISPITVTEKKDQYAFDPVDEKIKKVGVKSHQFSDEVVSEVDPDILDVKIESRSEKRRAKRMGRRLARAEKAEKKEAEATRLRGGLPSKGSKISVPRTRLAKLGGAKGAESVRYREGGNRAVARTARAGIAAKPNRIATRRLPENDVEHFIRTHS